MEFSSFLSSLGGGATILALSAWIFNKLVDRVDELANKVSQIDKIFASREYELNEIKNLIDSVHEHNERLGVLESQSNSRYNGRL